MRIIILAMGLVMLCGCSTLAERGKIEMRIDPETGKEKKIYIPEEYQRITGQGSEVKWEDESGLKSGKLLPNNIGIPKVEIDK